MRRNGSMEWWRGIAAGVTGTIGLLFAVTASAVPANFDSTGIGFVPSPEISALPGFTVDLSTPLYAAGDPSGGGSFEVDFSGSAAGEVCILSSASPNACQADLSGVTTPYSALVTLEISAINTSGIVGPFTLALTMLDLGTGTGNEYDASEVSIALDPTAPMPLDTTAVPGFDFDGTFDPFVRIQDLACSNSGGNCNYLGWTIGGGLVGESVTFRFDMSTAPNGRDSPRLLFNAIPVVVPEPGTALLMALGLAGLSAIGRDGRRASANRQPGAE